MKKFMAVLMLGMIFIACDYAKEAVEYKPDIECVHVTPMGYYVTPYDSNLVMMIDTLKFVAENSVDCYLREVTWEYVDTDDDTFYVGDPLALYAKIEGIVDPEAVDTTIIINLGLPLLPALDHLADPNTPDAARAYLHFVAQSEYDPEETDTCDIWYGIYYISP